MCVYIHLDTVLLAAEKCSLMRHHLCLSSHLLEHLQWFTCSLHGYDHQCVILYVFFQNEENIQSKNRGASDLAKPKYASFSWSCGRCSPLVATECIHAVYSQQQIRKR